MSVVKFDAACKNGYHIGTNVQLLDGVTSDAATEGVIVPEVHVVLDDPQQDMGYLYGLIGGGSKGSSNRSAERWGSGSGLCCAVSSCQLLQPDKCCVPGVDGALLLLDSEDSLELRALSASFSTRRRSTWDHALPAPTAFFACLGVLGTTAEMS